MIFGTQIPNNEQSEKSGNFHRKWFTFFGILNNKKLELLNKYIPRHDGSHGYETVMYKILYICFYFVLIHVGLKKLKIS